MTSVSERNKHKVLLFVDAVWNQGRLELIDELVAADYLGGMSGLHEGVVGPEGVRRLVSSRRRAYPGLHIKIDDQIAEEDRVVTRWQAWLQPGQAHDGAGAAGGRRCCQGVSIIRLLAGKQVDFHTEYTSLDPDLGERSAHSEMRARGARSRSTADLPRPSQVP
jgi:predicted ester cyclase